MASWLRCCVAALLFLLHINVSSQAGVTYFGAVEPDPNASGIIGDVLNVGVSGVGDDFRGYVKFDGGSQVTYDSLVVGKDEDYQGLVIIAGSLSPGGQTTLSLDQSTNISNAAVQIGRDGVGEVRVENGGALRLINSSGDMYIGQDATSVGKLVVDGTFSYVNLPDHHVVGGDGVGHMDILNGGFVHNTGSTDTAIIGNGTGVGSVQIDGTGSIWKVEGNVSVGEFGVGTLTISNDGLVDLDGSASETTVGASGRLVLQQGTLAAAEVTLNGGYLGGSGLIQGTVAASLDSLIEAKAEELLRFGGSVSNTGSIVVDGGEIDFLDALVNDVSNETSEIGRITVNAGRLRLSQMMTNEGVLALESGVNHLHGPIANAMSGAIVLASDSVGTFYDAVDVATGSLELLAGANALFLDDLTFSTGGEASLQLGASLSASSQINVSGQAVLAGDLEVQLADGNPAVGDSFALLTASEGVVGEFDDVTLPELSTGLAWDVQYEADAVRLRVVEGMLGDFNEDGVTNGLDFLAWQRGESPDPLSQDDLRDWSLGYEVHVPLSATVAAVPEAASLSLGLLAALLLNTRRK